MVGRSQITKGFVGQSKEFRFYSRQWMTKNKQDVDIRFTFLKDHCTVNGFLMTSRRNLDDEIRWNKWETLGMYFGGRSNRTGDFNPSAALNHHYFLRGFQVFLLAFLLPLWLFLHHFLCPGFFSSFLPLNTGMLPHTVLFLSTVIFQSHGIKIQSCISSLDCSHNPYLLNSSI